MKKILTIAAALTLGTMSAAYAQDTSTDVASTDAASIETPHGAYKEIGTSGDWTTIQFEVDGQTVCSIFSRPKDSKILEDGEAISAYRGERAVFITWEGGLVNEAAGVFSALVGAPLADSFGEHKFTTEHGEFDLFGFEDRLFVSEGEDTPAIDAIRRGLELKLEAVLPGGRIAQDTYSLRGVMNATKAAAEVCGAV